MDNDNFLSVVNKNLTVSAEKATQEMSDAATVAHKCIIKLGEMLDRSQVPVGYDKDGCVIYSEHTPQVINNIAQANNTATMTLRKIRKLDKEDESATDVTSIDALLRSAHSKLKLTQVTQSIEISTAKTETTGVTIDQYKDLI